MGFLVDFLSHASIVGFMAGAAVVIGLQQLKGLLGLDHFTHKTDMVSVLKSVFRSIGDSVSSIHPPYPHQTIPLIRSCCNFFFFK